MTHHFIIEENDLYEGKKVYLSAEETRHLSKALRVSKAEAVILINGDGKIYTSEVIGVKDNAELRILSVNPGRKEIFPQISAVIPLLKKSRFEMMLEKLTEIGANEIFIYFAEKGSVPPCSYNSRYYNRWRSIILSAVKQSKRAIYPVLHTPVRLEEILSEISRNKGIKVFLDQGNHHYTLDLISDKLFFIVGGEGGYSEKEMTSMIQNGFRAVNISVNQLRSETAAIIFFGIAAYLRGAGL